MMFAEWKHACICQIFIKGYDDAALLLSEVKHLFVRLSCQPCVERMDDIAAREMVTKPGFNGQWDVLI